MERAVHGARGTESRRARRVAQVGALLLGLVGLAGDAAAQQAPASVYLFRSGVWLDAERGRAYLMQPGAGVEAIDLATGQALWREAQLEKPLWADGSRLLAQRMESADKVSLALLDVSTEQPRELWRSSQAVPAGVRVSIDAGKSEFFHMQACERATGLGLEWKFDEIKKPFWAREPEVEGMNRRVGGSLLLDLSSGQLRESTEQACEPPAPSLTGSMPRAGSRTESGRTVRYASADGRHYLASGPVPGSSAQPRYTWEIYETATGQRIAELEQPLLAAWFVVRGDLVIHDVSPADSEAGVEPPRIRAVQAATGAEAWSRAYRNTRFTGIPEPQAAK